MVKARTWLALALISFGTIAATASCGSDETTGGGTGGGLLGGSGGSAGSGGAVSRGGSSGTSGTTGTIISNLGIACTTDANCGDGMTCVLPSSTAFGTGGPGAGMCTKVCATDSDCSAIESDAACIPIELNDPTGFCLQPCVQGNPTSALDKCQGRPDFLCVDLAGDGSAPFCIPDCQSDSECGTGLFCNRRSGLCESTKPTGLPAGSACDPAATADPCLGICLQTSDTGVTPVVGACFDPCPVGTECLFAGTQAGGVCDLVSSAGFGFLDPGLCDPGCSCDEDCAVPGEACRGWATDASSVQLKQDIGSDGICSLSANSVPAGSTELTCGAAGAGAGGASGNPGGDNAGAAGN